MTLTISYDSAARHAGDKPRRVKRALGMLKSAGQVAVSKLVTPHKAALGRLTEMPLTVLGTGSIDFAGFHLAHGWGWLITGISLYVIEHLISDVEEHVK